MGYFTVTCKDKYPHLFKECFEYSIGKGWENLVDEFCRSCGELNIKQVKEKFGTLRIYTDSGGPRIWDILDKLEMRSTRTCQMCGLNEITLPPDGICKDCKKIQILNRCLL